MAVSKNTQKLLSNYPIAAAGTVIFDIDQAKLPAHYTLLVQVRLVSTSSSSDVGVTLYQGVGFDDTAFGTDIGLVGGSSVPIYESLGTALLPLQFPLNVSSPVSGATVANINNAETSRYLRVGIVNGDETYAGTVTIYVDENFLPGG